MPRVAITHAPTRGRGLIDSLRMYHRGVDGDTTLDPEVPEGKVDRMRRELQTIRNRRSKTERRRFPNGIEDYVLITGFVLGALYLALITSMSTGVFGDSVAMDEASSRTFLDIGEPCLDRSDETFILIFIDNDAETVMIEPKNLMPSDELLIEWAWDNGSRTNESVPAGYGANVLLPFNDLEEGNHTLFVTAEAWNGTNTSDREVVELVQGSYPIHVESTTGGPSILAILPWSDAEEHRTAELLEEDESRACWTMTDMGRWAYLLIGAELGGGRETAMLSGGAAGIPAWWMAFTSLMLSVVTLFVIYPMLYKLYHNETDDMLTRQHTKALIADTINETAKRLSINVDWELYVAEEREVSIDIMVPFQFSDGTLSDVDDVRDAILRAILEEFAIFRIYKPVQLTVRPVGDGPLPDMETGIGVGGDNQRVEDVQDYTSFFRDLHLLSRVEEDVHGTLDAFFRARPMMHLRMATVSSDEEVVFVSVVYKPTLRLAFLRFKDTTEEIAEALEDHIVAEIGGVLQGRRVVIRARNQIQTLADRSSAGRVERMKSDDRVAAVARQDGFAGRVLQTKLFGDILSTVEFTANEKREFINRWGFWGLIGFVWIPFMASGVLVGSTIGLLSRMRFMTVLYATFIGGAAASITWAYTAEGIVSFMHQYKLEFVIPLAIVVFVGLAFLHMRTTKSRRQAELFEETLLDAFHADISEKYGGA